MTQHSAVILLFVCAFFACTGETRKGKIVFQSNRDGNFEIYSMNDDGTNLIRLTNSISYDVSPSWSPDGSHILFASDRDDNWEIYTMRSNAEDVRRLTSRPGSNTAPSWAREGTKILFVSTRDAINGELYLMNPDGTNIERLTRDSTVKDTPVMTPDGASVVFAMDNRNASVLAVLSLSDGSISGLTSFSLNAMSPRVSPEGSLILFAGTRDGHISIFTMTRTGENVQRLTQMSDDCRTPVWKGSEREIVYSKNGGLYLLSLETQKEVKLTGRGDSSPHWVGE